LDQISEILIGLIFRYNNKGLPILKYFSAGFKVCFSGQRALLKKASGSRYLAANSNSANSKTHMVKRFFASSAETTPF
jgi:hypothetical protein